MKLKQLARQTDRRDDGIKTLILKCFTLNTKIIQLFTTSSIYAKSKMIIDFYV